MQATKSRIRDTLILAASLLVFVCFLFYLRSVQRHRLHRRRLQRWKQETRAVSNKKTIQQQQPSHSVRQTHSRSAATTSANSPYVKARLDRKANGSVASNLNVLNPNDMVQAPSSRPFATLGRSASGKLPTLAQVQSQAHAQQQPATARKSSAAVPAPPAQDESLADGGDGGGSSAASRVEAWRNELADVTAPNDAGSTRRSQAPIPMAEIVASRKNKRGHESEDEEEEQPEQASEGDDERMVEDVDNVSEMDEDLDNKPAGKAVSSSIQRSKKRRVRRADEDDQTTEGDRDDEDMDAAARPTIKRNMSGPRGVKRSAEDSASPVGKSARRRAHNDGSEASETESAEMDEDRVEQVDAVDTSMDALSAMPDAAMDMCMDESMIASPIKRHQLREARLSQSDDWRSRLEAEAAIPKKTKSRNSMQSVLPAKIRLPGDGPRKNTHRVETLDWMRPGDDAEDLEGIKWRMDDDGRLRRLEHIRSMRFKHNMPRDSLHPDAKAMEPCYVERWLTNEEYDVARKKLELDWQRLEFEQEEKMRLAAEEAIRVKKQEALSRKAAQREASERAELERRQQMHDRLVGKIKMSPSNAKFLQQDTSLTVHSYDGDDSISLNRGSVSPDTSLAVIKRRDSSVSLGGGGLGSIPGTPNGGLKTGKNGRISLAYGATASGGGTPLLLRPRSSLGVDRVRLSSPVLSDTSRQQREEALTKALEREEEQRRRSSSSRPVSVIGFPETTPVEDQNERLRQLLEQRSAELSKSSSPAPAPAPSQTAAPAAPAATSSFSFGAPAKATDSASSDQPQTVTQAPAAFALSSATSGATTAAPASTPATGPPKFSFGAPSSGAAAASLAPATPPPAKFTFGSAATAPAAGAAPASASTPKSTFSFGAPAAAAPTASTPAAAPKATFTFGAPATTSASAPATSTAASASGGFTFSFGSK